MSPPQEQKGANGQALGRSRGGFGTKIHLKTDHDGFPIAFELTGGEAADSPLFEALIDAGPDEAPRAIVCDKGYDSDANRMMARERGAVPIIPHRSIRKAIPARFAKALYRGRARIEQMMRKLKRFKRFKRPDAQLVEDYSNQPSLSPSLHGPISEQFGSENGMRSWGNGFVCLQIVSQRRQTP